ncbi:MAG: ribonuclease P protein component [Acidobacteriota bacterium]|nr:ribonuclease P protein component [Acidobacteriota bacterium]
MARFLPAEHVRKRADFELIYKTGFKRSGRLMTMFTREREAGPARLGIAATRKMGASVERNRAKRLARELFRHHKPAGAVDVVVVPRREMLEAPYARVETEFLSLLARVPSTRPRPALPDASSLRAGKA